MCVASSGREWWNTTTTSDDALDEQKRIEPRFDALRKKLDELGADAGSFRAVDRFAVLLFRLRCAIAKAVGKSSYSEPGGVADTAENLLRWTPEEEERAFRRRLPAIGRVWYACRLP